MVSIGSTTVMVLAFFLPAVQDQWDRYESRKIIEQYDAMGDKLFREERFDMAEQAYSKAFELSEEKRLDIETKRLNAKVSKISMLSEWGAALPDDIEEVDFQFLLHLQDKEDDRANRIITLNSYGIFLSRKKKVKEAEAALNEAISLDSTDVLAYINLGNLYDQQNSHKKAEAYYRKSLALEPDNALIHYNLGLLYAETGKIDSAREAFKKAIRLSPDDTDAIRELNNLPGE